MPSSGATNRQKAREAEAGRRAEQIYAPRRLANLPPDQADQARHLMDLILAGHLRDPDAAAEEGDDVDPQ